ncbi:MAG: hypothetical protein M3R61_04900 [Chloroflexota bacterium]|nr:hypothetical protein [Chloroflexota bacterium]
MHQVRDLPRLGWNGQPVAIVIVMIAATWAVMAVAKRVTTDDRPFDAAVPLSRVEGQGRRPTADDCLFAPISCLLSPGVLRRSIAGAARSCGSAG